MTEVTRQVTRPIKMISAAWQNAGKLARDAGLGEQATGTIRVSDNLVIGTKYDKPNKRQTVEWMAYNIFEIFISRYHTPNIPEADEFFFLEYDANLRSEDEALIFINLLVPDSIS